MFHTSGEGSKPPKRQIEKSLGIRENLAATSLSLGARVALKVHVASPIPIITGRIVTTFTLHAVLHRWPPSSRFVAVNM